MRTSNSEGRDGEDDEEEGLSRTQSHTGGIAGTGKTLGRHTLPPLATDPEVV